MKNTTILVLILLGLYWLLNHTAPFPLNHESLGLYYHTTHKILGVILLAVVAFLTWKWKFKNQ